MSAEPAWKRVEFPRIQDLTRNVTILPVPHEELDVRMPFSGGVLGRIPSGTPEDVGEAVRRAREAQPAWAGLRFKDRARVMLRFHDLLLDRHESALDLIQLESGKARRHALEEIFDTALVARHYAHHAERYLRPRKHPGGLPVLTRAVEYRHPVGVVGFIAPWNFPLILSITDVIAALMAGNAAVLRPDPQSSFTALWALSLLREAGLPDSVLQIVTGEGPVIGPALIEQTDYIMFTGSTGTGKLIARQAADRLMGFSLELGGKNPMLVLKDANLEASVDGAIRGAFVGAGQVCVSIERLYVHSSLYEPFRKRMIERLSCFKLGSVLDYGVDMGSLTVPRQLKTVEAHIQEALNLGAKLLYGGRARPDLGPLFYEPTVLEGVTPQMKLFSEETFGPVLALYRFDSEDEAIRLANESAFGLNASVWSKNTARAVEIAKKIHAGSVNINEVYGATWTATSSPIGGRKQSGIGRRHGAEGILKYTEAQTLAIQRGMPLAPPPWIREKLYASLMTQVLKVLKRLPGLR